MKIPKAVFVCFLSLTLVDVAHGGDWVDLFNGRDIEGWTKVGGDATYAVEDGAIVGTTRPKTPNTFLCPPREFGNFELTFDVKCDPELNSGVQIRSINSAAKVPDALNDDQRAKLLKRVEAGSLGGPQVEIAANGNAGGVWFEAVGPWALPPNKEVAQTAYKKDDWNSYRVIAEDARIQVWINGTKVTDADDAMTHLKKGKLGFQVHGVGNRTEPLQVRWRNIKIREL